MLGLCSFMALPLIAASIMTLPMVLLLFAQRKKSDPPSSTALYSPLPRVEGRSEGLVTRSGEAGYTKGRRVLLHCSEFWVLTQVPEVAGMRCPQCGYDNKERANCCNECGSRLEVLGA